MLAGLCIVTYVLGLRHGVDADHIVAIDNTIRKLLQDDQKPFSVGLWFSLGHSTVVMGLIVALVFATLSVVGVLPVLRSGVAIIGTMVLGVFHLIRAFVSLLTDLWFMITLSCMEKGVY